MAQDHNGCEKGAGSYSWEGVTRKAASAPGNCGYGAMLKQDLRTFCNKTFIGCLPFQAQQVTRTSFGWTR